MKTNMLGHLDHEWMELVKEARDLGLSVEQVKEFLLVNSSQTFASDKPSIEMASVS